jgi:hypothetical protein
MMESGESSKMEIPQPFILGKLKFSYFSGTFIETHKPMPNVKVFNLI